jgi:hypothetical protein
MKLTTNRQVDSRNNGPAQTQSAVGSSRAVRNAVRLLMGRRRRSSLSIEDGNHRVSAG